MKLLFCIFILLPCFSFALDTSGLQISGSGDIVGSFNLPRREGGTAEDKINPREFELLLYAPIDYLFDATISSAAHLENGEQKFELHEGFISTSKLLPNWKFKLGKFFLGVGRLNQIHRHEWPFITAPKVHTDFFDEEGAQDTGGEVNVLLPTNFYLDLTLGCTNGWTFGRADSLGTQPLVPTHYARVSTFVPLGSGDASIGVNYVGRTDSANTKMHLGGIDFTAKWKDNKILRYLIQSEYWFRSQTDISAGTEKKWGVYLFPQYGFNENWLLGSRIDYFTDTAMVTTAIVPTVTYKASEFSTFRLAYTRQFQNQSSQVLSDVGIIEVQGTFIIGAHPAHSF